MATFNGAAHIAAQLESFALQTRRPDELIVCDDGSTDGTLEIVDGFARQVPFDVVVERNSTRLGFTGNFSKAMELATGDVIFLSDQDDAWDPAKIETVLHAFANNPEQWLVVHDGRLVDPAIEWSGVTMLGQIMAGYGTSRSLITGALTVFRRELQKCALPVPDGMVGHDQWLHLVADLLGKRLVIPDVLQTIRRHGGNASTWVASSPNKISKWDVLKSQRRTAIAVDYSDRLLINVSVSQILRRLAEKSGPEIDLVTVGASLDFLADELSALVRRQRLVGRGWFLRKLLAVGLFSSGGYRHFNGVRSCVRDFCR